MRITHSNNSNNNVASEWWKSIASIRSAPVIGRLLNIYALRRVHNGRQIWIRATWGGCACAISVDRLAYGHTHTSADTCDVYVHKCLLILVRAPPNCNKYTSLAAKRVYATCSSDTTTYLFICTYSFKIIFVIYAIIIHICNIFIHMYNGIFC